MAFHITVDELYMNETIMYIDINLHEVGYSNLGIHIT